MPREMREIPHRHLKLKPKIKLLNKQHQMSTQIKLAKFLQNKALKLVKLKMNKLVRLKKAHQVLLKKAQIVLLKKAHPVLKTRHNLRAPKSNLLVSNNNNHLNKLKNKLRNNRKDSDK